LVNPINPFNPNPSSDHRKRSALINGPIINLDHSLQLPTQQSDETALLYALKDMFECMIENKSQIGVVSPSHFVAKLKEKNYLFRQVNMHQDAHEFYNYLINEIIEVVDKECGPGHNWCNEIFQGMITNETKCLSCETITSKEEEFLDLSIDIPPGSAAYSLTHCLNNFSRLETLAHQNKFYCNNCCSLQEATKTIKLKKLPEVLVINFKRFKYDESVDKMVKLFDSISYPFNLRLFNTSTKGTTEDFTLYELYALVIHIGGGPMHGHYVALCKIKAQLWLLFDDETVEVVDDSFVLKFFGNGPGLASAYILFYQKVHMAGSLGFREEDVYCGEDWMPPRHDSAETVQARSQPEAWSTHSSESGSSDSVKDLSTSAVFDKNPFKKNYKIENKEDTISRTSSTKEKQPEKKTWVGGLKRRQSKNDVPADRKASTGSVMSTPSTNSDKDKRKSFFGFKRKQKEK
jgi:ubiquitin carboxyl-terminal hydrolase 9/13